MSVDETLRACARAGVIVWNEGCRLRYRTLTGDGLPADLADALRAHRDELLALLAGRPEPRPGRCWTCGGEVAGWPDALYANCATCASEGARRVLARLRGDGSPASRDRLGSREVRP
jgi:hypothetical protein